MKANLTLVVKTQFDYPRNSPESREHTIDDLKDELEALGWEVVSDTCEDESNASKNETPPNDCPECRGPFPWHRWGCSRGGQFGTIIKIPT